MAYMNQEKKAGIAKALKAIIPGSWKYSLAVRHHSTIVLTIAQAPVDFIGDYLALEASRPAHSRIERNTTPTTLDVNPYWYRDHFSAEIVALLDPIFAALNDGNFNKSDLQSDYHHVGWYVDVNIGRWNKPFVCTAPQAKPAPQALYLDDADAAVLECRAAHAATPATKEVTFEQFIGGTPGMVEAIAYANAKTAKPRARFDHAAAQWCAA